MAAGACLLPSCGWPALVELAALLFCLASLTEMDADAALVAYKGAELNHDGPSRKVPAAPKSSSQDRRG